MPTLLTSSASPFVRKVLVCAHELGAIDQIVRQPVVTSPIANDATLVKHNPLAKIPTLLLEDGTSLYDSHVICEYLDHVYGNGRLIPPLMRFSVLRHEALANGILDAALLLRYETAVRPSALQWPAWRDAQFLKVSRGLAEMAREIPTDAQRCDLGGISMAIALSYLDFRFAEYMWRDEQPTLASWYAAFSQRPSMLATALCA